MRGLVRFVQSSRADVRVDLRRGEALVPEHFLDASQVRSAVEEVGRKAVPQCVGAYVTVESRLGQVFLQHPADAASCQPATEPVEKQRHL